MRLAALAFVSVATTLLMLAPAVTGRDGFPVSSHPMYATARPPDASFVTARATTAAGQVVSLSIRVIGETDDPLVAEGRLRRAADLHDGVAECARIAADIDRSHPLDTIVAIEIIRVEASVTDFVRTDGADARVEVVTRCPVR